MALFGTKKTAKKVAKKAAVKTEKVVKTDIVTNYAHVLRNPRITEKASDKAAQSVYTFDITSEATKPQIAAAVRELYKVSPRKIAVVTIHPKQTRNMRTGKRGMKSGGRKAYVYLKTGETITIA